MALQLRRGAYEDFDPDKMVAAEVAVVTSGDPNSNSGRSIYMCFEPGVVKRLADYEDILDLFEDAEEEATERAEAAAQSAESSASAAEAAAQTAATEAAEEAVEAVQSQLEDLVDEAQEIADSIPEDYTALSNEVEELEAKVDTKAPAIYCTTSGSLVTIPDGADGLEINDLTVDENATVLRIRSRNINTFYRGNPYGGKGVLPSGQTRYMQFQFSYTANSQYRGVWIPPHTTVYGKVVLDVSPGAKWNVNGSWYHLKDSNSLTSQDTNLVKTFTVSNNADVERNIRIWLWTTSGGSFANVEATLMLSLTGYEDFEEPTGCDYNLNGAEDDYNFSLPAKTVFGDNTIWSDVGNVEFSYKADTKLYIENLTKPSEDDLIANSAIESGKFFMINNRLFLSTASIANGATITPGTNATELSLSEALNSLNA